MVFDKTGTLTENGISVTGMKIFNGKAFSRKLVPKPEVSKAAQG